MGDHLSWGVQWLKARGCAAAPKPEDLLPAACGLIRALAELVLENEEAGNLWETVIVRGRRTGHRCLLFPFGYT